MAQRIADSIRISLKDGHAYERSVLVTGMAQDARALAQRLENLGLASRTFGQLIVASGRIIGVENGVFAEFNEPCVHQTLQDATRHAVRSLTAMLRDCGIEAEVSDEAPEPGLVDYAGTFNEQFSWANRS